MKLHTQILIIPEIVTSWYGKLTCNGFILLYENMIGLILRIIFCVVNETAEHYNFCYIHQVVLQSDFV
jgi:hypothetical protein